MNWLSWPVAALGVILVVVVVFAIRFSKGPGLNSKPNVYDADEDFELVDDGALLSVRNDFPPAARRQWEDLIEEVRKETGGLVRQGHMYWMIDVIVRGAPRHPVYKCDPPAGWKGAGE